MAELLDEHLDEAIDVVAVAAGLDREEIRAKVRASLRILESACAEWAGGGDEVILDAAAKEAEKNWIGARQVFRILLARRCSGFRR